MLLSRKFSPANHPNFELVAPFFLLFLFKTIHPEGKN